MGENAAFFKLFDGFSRAKEKSEIHLRFSNLLLDRVSWRPGLWPWHCRRAAWRVRDRFSRRLQAPDMVSFYPAHAAFFAGRIQALSSRMASADPGRGTRMARVPSPLWGGAGVGVPALNWTSVALTPPSPTLPHKGGEGWWRHTRPPIPDLRCAASG